eukprot:CAMPEP_0180502674 /NCGR_PEP_ID=MMETSP1036_2-20121128/45572_1 /TAXON_ID=632150 /ORGANISM="Azadinium spinosum, Strain 3D9" /LENGTH=204 /DNA_ID=CAMNT_0022511545 /DNA_START=39 /DNA_END=650 /DNA_ORIENTATION=+
MACCDLYDCRFHTALPCKDQFCGFCFCFFSKPRCRYCQELYDQVLVCPWHWCSKRKQKAKTVGDLENTVCGPLSDFFLGLLASVVLFIILGSAHYRRDGNQAMKGLVNAGLLWVSLGSAFAIGPGAVLLFLFGSLCASSVVDWFVPGRCDNCYGEPCGCLGRCCGCCCPYFGRIEVEKEEKEEKAEKQEEMEMGLTSGGRSDGA